MKQKSKRIMVGMVVAVGIVLLCSLCYFASSAATNKLGDTYAKASNNANNITARAQEESEKISEDEMKDFEDIDVDTYIDLYNDDEKAVVLFSRPTCGFCQIAEPILHHIAYQYDLTIKHVNTDEMDSDDSTNLVESDDYFSEGFGTPLLVVVANGKIIDVVSGLVDTSSYIDFFSDNGLIEG